MGKIRTYLAAAAPPLFTALALSFFVPPIWLPIDSAVILLWPTEMVPHYPPLYPEIIHALKTTLGTSRAMLWTLIGLQHAAMILAITYLATAFDKPLPAFIVSVCAVAGTWLGTLPHTITTQGVEFPFLVLLCGVTLRASMGRWSTRLGLVFFLSVLGLALSRHASIIFAGMLPAFFVLSALFGAPVWRRAAACSVVIVAAWFSGQFVTRAICVLQRGTDCPYSITGRAGCYRIEETMTLIPAEQRERWLETKTAQRPPQEAFALRAMAEKGCWTGAYHAVRHAFTNENPDHWMNAAFVHYLLTPDQFSLAQQWKQTAVGAAIAQYPMMMSRLFFYSAFPPSHSIHYDIRKSMGNDEGERSIHKQFSSEPLFAFYDRFIASVLNPLALIALVLVAVIRRNATALFGIAVVGSAVVYLIAVFAVTTLVEIYLAPIHFLLFLALGVSAIDIAGGFLPGRDARSVARFESR